VILQGQQELSISDCLTDNSLTKGDIQKAATTDRSIESNDSQYITEPGGTLADMEWRMIQICLKKYAGNQTAAAAELGISRSTLWKKLKRFQSDGDQLPEARFFPARNAPEAGT
jgi:transcriptional regulator with PAS, ATPase and Fis domain